MQNNAMDRMATRGTPDADPLRSLGIGNRGRSAKNMKHLLFATIFLVCLTHLSSAEDHALRAFLGLRASSVEMAAVQDNRFYVFTIAFFKDGKFLGYGQFHTGARTPQENNKSLEVIWGKKNEKMGYTSTSMSSSFDFSEDAFFEGVVLTMKGHEVPMTPNRHTYEGFRVVGFAAKPPEGKRQGFGNVLAKAPEEAAAEFPKLVLLLYQDFTDQKDYLDFVESKKPKR